MRKRRKKAPEKESEEEGSARISQYFFTFELLRQYPTIRSFIIKAPLKRSFGDTIAELFGQGKK